MYTSPGSGPRLPTQSPLAIALKNGEMARSALDWLMISLCVLGIYILVKSQLDHEINLSVLPQKKPIKESTASTSPAKIEMFSTTRSNEYEIWADLKDMIERKKPSKGHCQIQTNQIKPIGILRTARAKQAAPSVAVLGYELSCWTLSNKKYPSPHIGADSLLELKLLGNTQSDSFTNPMANLSTEILDNKTKKAHDLSLENKPIKPEGWIETPSGILRFDAKDERWK